MDIVLKDVCLSELSYLVELLRVQLIDELNKRTEILSKLDFGKYSVDESSLVDNLSVCNDRVDFINDLLSKFD